MPDGFTLMHLTNPPGNGYLGCLNIFFRTITYNVFKNCFAHLSFSSGIIIFLEQIPTHQ